MVTIEEKLSQFEQLVNNKVDRENIQKLDIKKQEVNLYISNEKTVIEENFKRNLKLSMDRIDRQKQEKLSTLTQEEKKEILKLSELFVKNLTKKVEDKCRAFTLSDEYPTFICSVLKKIITDEKILEKGKVNIFLAPANFKNTKNLFEAYFKGNNFLDYNIFEGDINFLGGFVLEVEKMNFRINKTLENAVESKKDDIGQFMQNYIKEGGVN